MANDKEQPNVSPAEAPKKTSAPKKTTSTPKTAEKAPVSATKSATPKATTTSKTVSASAPKATAPKTTAGAPKTTAPKTAPKAPGTAPAAPKAAAPKKVPTAANAAAATAPNAPKAPKKPANADEDVTVEEAKEAELQKVAEGGQSAAPQKKKTVKKLIYLLVIVAVIAAIAVVGVLVLPNLLKTEVEADITLTNPDATGTETTLNFTQPVEEYMWGSTIERGIAAKNTGDGAILLAFKLEIYDEQEGLIPAFMYAVPELNSTLWLSQTFTENGVQVTYYYYRDVVQADAILTLFKNYVVTAGSDDIANEYNQQTVFSRVTVHYTNATESNIDNLEDNTAECWKHAATMNDWKGTIRDRL